MGSPGRKKSDPHKNRSGRVPLQIPLELPEEQGLVTLRFLGAAQTTTGSLHRFRTPHGDLVLECGMYQGHRAEAEAWNRDLPVNPHKARAVILSHGHIDHCGALPNLVRRGFKGPVWCTEGTADLLPIMLLDAAHIQESDAARMNRRRKGGGPEKVPLFTTEDAKAALRLVRGVPYGKPFEAMKGVEARFVDAGHIIGSAAVHLTFRADGRETTVGFTGDLGRRDVPILRDPEPLGSVDWYITESTYGNRDHEDTDNLLLKLEDAVTTAVARGGKVIIPAFAVGRTQLVLYLLHKLRFDRRIPDVPIYVDSPMATRATEVFRQHQDLFDAEAREFLTCCGPLFKSARTSFVADVEESKALNTLDGPAVIISSSGMCEAGRILHHLKNHGTDRRSIVLFVGYQAMHTLGRRILEKSTNVRIYGEHVEIAAEVRKINGLSAHADRNGLLRYAQALERTPNGIFLVHGDTDRIAALQSWFHEHGLPGATGPAPGEWKRLL